jgi:putative ABC transport system ATP-binding protein
MEPLLRLDNVTKHYTLGDETVQALRGVSFDVARGEFVAIMGSSGSGKSTCMHILGCLDRPSSGSYRLEGREVGDLPRNALAEVRNRQLGFVFQGFNLLSRTSAVENVELPLIYARTPSRERRRKSLEALAQVGLADRAGHFNNQLSGGQQQRVAIARALVNSPSLVLADEPTGNLDSRTSQEIMDIFTSINARGVTIVMVTHEPDIAAFASRQLLFKDGLLISDHATDRPAAAAPAQG